jgi:hypothetical protein
MEGRTQFLKGLAAASGTILALLVATIVFVFLKIQAYRAEYAKYYPPPTGRVGWDIKIFWMWMLHSPIYWLTMLALLGLSIWVFKHWVFSH